MKKSLDGLWQGYDGELAYAARQILALVEAFPQDKFTWRPAPGVFSTAEMCLHLAQANFGLLRYTGIDMPPGTEAKDFKTSTTEKTAVVEWLRRSFEAVKAARAGLQPGDPDRPVTLHGRSATVNGIYMRLLVHVHEHMGQLITYARSSGVQPPWSET